MTFEKLYIHAMATNSFGFIVKQFGVNELATVLREVMRRGVRLITNMGAGELLASISLQSHPTLLMSLVT